MVFLTYLPRITKESEDIRMNISNAQATYAPIYPSSIISHDTEEFNPVNEGILEDTEAKAATDTAAKTAPRKIATDAEADLLKTAGYNVDEGDELTEEQEAFLHNNVFGGSGNASMNRQTAKQYTAAEKAKLILAGDIEPLNPTQQAVINKVNEAIRCGLMSDITAAKLQDEAERAKIQARILNSLQFYRMAEIEAAGEAAALAAATMGKDAQDGARKAAIAAAAKSVKEFQNIPFSVIATLLEATDTVRVYATNREASFDEKQLIYRSFTNGKPTIWRVMSKTGIHNQPLVEIADIIGDLNPELNNTGKYNIIGYLMRTKNVLLQDTSKETQGTYIWALNGIIDLSRVKWNAAANGYRTPEGKVFDLHEYGSEKAEELAFKVIPTSLLRRYIPCVDSLPIPDKFNVFDKTHWNPIDGIKELFDDNEQYKADLMFYIMQGALRRTNYGRGFIFKDATEYAGGGNGKSTVVLMIEYLLGTENVLKRNIAQYEKDRRQLDGLEHSMAVLSTEMPDLSEALKGDVFKELIRQEGTISYDIKYKSPMTTFYRGPVIQCTNAKGIRFKDETDSMSRKYEVIEFRKSFAKEGTISRDYIQTDYIMDSDVLDYLAWYCLTQIPLLNLSVGFPVDLLNKLKEAKDDFIKDTRVVWKFWDYMLTPVTYTDEDGNTETYRRWNHNIIPLNSAEAIYRLWAADNNYSIANNEHFRNRKEQYIKTLSDWKFFDSSHKARLKAVEKNNPLPEVGKIGEAYCNGKKLANKRYYNETEEGFCYSEDMVKSKFAGYIMYCGI